MEIENGIRNAIIKFYDENKISFTQKEYQDVHLLMIDYFEILRKRIPPKKRKVMISKELKIKSKSSNFREWLPRFNELKKWFENGEDMNSFLSKRHKNSNYRDRLLTCWKIHHIHFFPEKKSGDMLLFAVVTEDAIYMVDVIPHSKTYVFSTYNMLNIIYDNWKFLYEPFRIKDATGVTEKITSDKDIDALRKAGVCTVIEIRGEVYCLDMMATSGHGTFDVLLADNILNTIHLNRLNGFFEEYEVEKVILTGYHHPCFIVICRDRQGNVYPWFLGGK